MADLPSASGGGAGGVGGAGGAAPEPLGTPVQISGSHSLLCIRFDQGSVWCWGEPNEYGVGDGSADFVIRTPRRIPIDDVVDIHVGTLHVCAVEANGTVWCWGQNSEQQLGVPGFGSTTPRQVPKVEGAVKVAAGGAGTCALLADSTVKCWGDNDTGEAGTGVTGGPPVAPTAIFTGAKALGHGALHACAAMLDGTVKCWGDNLFGQLGNGTQTWNPTPETIPELSGVRDISVSEDNTCAWTDDGTALCWGSNGFGAVSGDGIGYVFTAPWVVDGVGPVQSISSRVIRTCALIQGESVWCWGRNPISNQTENVPTMVEGVVNAQILGITDAVICFVDELGRVMTSGHDGNQGLGREGPGMPPAPVEFLDPPR